jgi:hypothetical protein
VFIGHSSLQKGQVIGVILYALRDTVNSIIVPVTFCKAPEGVLGVAKARECGYNSLCYVSPSSAEGGTMRVRIYLLMFAVACLVIGGCATPGVTINVDQGQTEPEGATATPVQEVTEPTPQPTETQPAPTAPVEPLPTNTLVVPPQAEESPTPEPPAATPGEEPPEAPAPIPTALVDPELVALWEYATALQEEVVQPLQEMGTTLEDLGWGSGQTDITAICTGIDVVVATLAEVQQGLDQVGPPPVDDADLQECYAEAMAAADDFQQSFQLLQSVCQTKNFGAAKQAGDYAKSGLQHLDNATQAMERWQTKVGL